METYKNLKKGTKIGLIISMVFIIFGIVLSVYNIVAAGRIPALPGEGMDLGANPAPAAHGVIPPVVRNCIDLVLLLAVTFYAVIGHKKPHGNMLKYLFLAFGTMLVLNVCLTGINGSISEIISSVLTGFAVMIFTYVSGRLDRINQNRIFLVIAGVFLLATMLIPAFSGFFLINGFLSSLTPLIVLLALGFAYTARYEEHIAAGLEDK